MFGSTREWNLISGLRVFGKVQAKQYQHRITASRKAQHAYSHLLHSCPQQAS